MIPDWKRLRQSELDARFNDRTFAGNSGVIPQPPMQITYEVSGNEPLHPDPSVCNRMYEASIGPCEFGCKVYADPRSNVRVLAHNRAYGCNK